MASSTAPAAEGPEGPSRRARTSYELDEQEQLNYAQPQPTRWSTLLLAYASLGVIYGDIGTSPLYTYASAMPPAATPADVLGISSMMFWIITLVVLVKYILIVLRADDNGEGGTFALYSLLCRSIGLTPFGAEVAQEDCELSRYSSLPADQHSIWGAAALSKTVRCLTGHQAAAAVLRSFRHSKVLQMALLLTVVLSTAMVVGDGILTPAISVLGAVDGLQVATNNISQGEIVGISVAVLVVLFASQRYGTSIMGRCFAPIVIIWLGMNAGIGIWQLAMNGGSIFASLNPWHIVDFFLRNGHTGWLLLGGVVLCITGAEALYSDLGHFSRKAISLGFIAFVYPCLLLTYWGQGSYLLIHPEHAKDTYWKTVPPPMFWPMFVAAVLASVVASQALISGAFSIMRQATMLGLFPKMTLIHTGHEIEGQIYMPEVNYTLMVLCIAVTAGFQSTHSLGEAYGVAVMSVMLITTVLLALVMLMAWGMHPALVALFLVVYLPLEGAILSATLVKIPSGGWVALVVAVILGLIKITWWWGASKKRAYNRLNKGFLCNLLKEVDVPDHQLIFAFGTLLHNNSSTSSADGSSHPFNSIPCRQLILVASGEPVVRMAGLGVYYSENSGGVPAVMRHVLANMPALYSSMVFMTVRFVAVPTVEPEERLLIRRDRSISSCFHVICCYGYTDRVDFSCGDGSHNEFMDGLVYMLLRHLLERKGIGSPGAALRLITTLAARAAAVSEMAAGLAGSVALSEAEESLAGAVAAAAMHGSSDGSSLSEILTAAAAATKAAANAAATAGTAGKGYTRKASSAGRFGVPAALAGGTCNRGDGFVSSLLGGLTAPEMMDILLQPASCDGNGRNSVPTAGQQGSVRLSRAFTGRASGRSSGVLLTASHSGRKFSASLPGCGTRASVYKNTSSSFCALAASSLAAATADNTQPPVDSAGDVVACVLIKPPGIPPTPANIPGTPCVEVNARCTGSSLPALGGSQSDAAAAGTAVAAVSAAGSAPEVRFECSVSAGEMLGSRCSSRRSTCSSSGAAAAGSGGLVSRLAAHAAATAASVVAALPSKQRSSGSLQLTAPVGGGSRGSSGAGVDAAAPATADDGSPDPPNRLPSYFGDLRRLAADDSDEEEQQQHSQLTADSGSRQLGVAGQGRQLGAGAIDTATEPAAVISSNSGSSGISRDPLQQQQQKQVKASAALFAGDGATASLCCISSTNQARCAAADEAGLLSPGQVTALQEAAILLQDYQRRWVHCVGRSTLKVLPGRSIAHRVLLGGLYRFLADNSRQVTGAWGIPTRNLIELGMDVEV